MNNGPNDLTRATLEQLNSTAPPDFTSGAGPSTNRQDSGQSNSGPARPLTRIGTLDLRRTFAQYWKWQQADAATKASFADRQKHLESMYNDYKKSTDEYQRLLDRANDQAVSEQERDRRKKEAESKLKDLMATKDTLDEYNRRSQAQADEQLNLVWDSTLKEIEAVVKAKAEAGGYCMVFNSAAVSPDRTPVLPYVNDPLNDLTDAVLKQLNATAPPYSSSAASANQPAAGQTR